MTSQRTRQKPGMHAADAAKQFQANPQQAAAIAHKDGPAAFIAAAGTGKTSILVQRLVRLVAEEHIAPEEILCVKFKSEAADEMEKREGKAIRDNGLSAKEIKKMRVVTLNGLGNQMLREKIEIT